MNENNWDQLMHSNDDFAKWLNRWLESQIGIPHETAIYIKLLILVSIVFIISAILWLLSKRILLNIINKLIKTTKTKWDDILLENNVFGNLSHIIPTLFVGFSAKFVFSDFDYLVPFVSRISNSAIMVFVLMALIGVLNAAKTILKQNPILKDKPIDSYIQLTKIFTYFICGILLISILLEKSPLYFFSALGAMTAVLLLIFKDTILGFVASIQLAANDMVRIGDWVTVPKYGADGDIVEINLATIKVQNFDKTITTIPTYVFISDSFTNWRGMVQSPGRRIKRSVSINITSVKFCTQEMLSKFSNFHLLTSYLDEKSKEISEFNKTNNIDKTHLINGRRLTNIGVFRKYIELYLISNPNINKEMTCMVRQLAPAENGLPIEIYAFSGDKVWVNYEGIIADIFDHLLSAIPEFELEVFQNPSGKDFKNYNSSK